MSLNQEMVRFRCQEIEESLERLEKIRGQSKEAFLRDRDAQDIACYRLLVAIEAALSFATMSPQNSSKKCLKSTRNALPFWPMQE